MIDEDMLKLYAKKLVKESEEFNMCYKTKYYNTIKYTQKKKKSQTKAIQQNFYNFLYTL